MTLNLIETFKTSIYNPEHTKTQNILRFFKQKKEKGFGNPYFQKCRV